MIGLVGADQDAAWRQTTLAQIFLTPVVLRRLAEAGRLEELTKLIDGEKDPGRRRELLASWFRNDEAVATLLDADQLEFVLQLVSKEPDKSHRGSWLCRVASSPEAAAALTAGRRLETLRDYADRNLDPQGTGRALHSELIHAPATAAACWNAMALRECSHWLRRNPTQRIAAAFWPPGWARRWCGSG